MRDFYDVKPQNIASALAAAATGQLGRIAEEVLAATASGLSAQEFDAMMAGMNQALEGSNRAAADTLRTRGGNRIEVTAALREALDRSIESAPLPPSVQSALKAALAGKMTDLEAVDDAAFLGQMMDEARGGKKSFEETAAMLSQARASDAEHRHITGVREAASGAKDDLNAFMDMVEALEAQAENGPTQADRERALEQLKLLQTNISVLLNMQPRLPPGR